LRVRLHERGFGSGVVRQHGVIDAPRDNRATHGYSHVGDIGGRVFDGQGEGRLCRHCRSGAGAEQRCPPPGARQSPAI
jgi:hypothetical protein